MTIEATDDAQDPGDYGIGRLFWVTSEAIVAADLDTEQIVLWNPAAEKLFGYAASEALGMPLARLVAEELRDAHLEGVRRYRGGGAPVLVGGDAVAVTAVTSTGERRDVSLTLADMSEGEARRRVLAVIRDVTDQVRAELELSKTNEVMREFVATASHDLGTPLTAVLGFSRLLSQYGENLDADKREEYLGAIVRNAEHASRLVQDLLMISQIRTGAISPNPAPVGVAAAATAACERARSEAAVTVEADLTAFVDPDHLERMLVNYLSNAARHGQPPVTVAAAPEDDHVVVRVSDRGAGVPDDFVDQLFNTFARANPTAGPGTGLGLSIVRGLAEANGGTAFYERNEELGSSFGLRLPSG